METRNLKTGLYIVLVFDVLISIWILGRVALMKYDLELKQMSMIVYMALGVFNFSQVGPLLIILSRNKYN
jgi:hypothetical protein